MPTGTVQETQVWIALGIFLLASVLLRTARERRRLRRALVFVALFAVIRTLRVLPSPWLGDEPILPLLSTAMLQLAAIQVGRVLLFNLLLRRVRVPRWATEAVVIAGYLAVLLNLLYRAGVNVTGIFATSAVATAVLGLALQETLANIASGIAIQLEGSIQNDQFVKCGDLAGWILHVRLRHTEFKTVDGDTIAVPNSHLTRSHVTVLGEAQRRSVILQMPYAYDPQSVIKAVEAALRSAPIEGVASTPPPDCVVEEMGPANIRYAARIWLTKPGRHANSLSDVNVRLFYALKRAGMPFGELPHTVEMVAPRSVPPSIDHVELLRGAHFLRHVSDDDLALLGEHLTHLSYAPGEYIIRQGESGDSMFFIVEGQVSVRSASEGGAETEIGTMANGDFFGERALMTGEARNASVVAETLVECCILNKAGIQDLMRRQPMLAEDVSVVMARRQIELAGIREKLDQETARLRERESQMQLLDRIRRFFGDA